MWCHTWLRLLSRRRLLRKVSLPGLIKCWHLQLLLNLLHHLLNTSWRNPCNRGPIVRSISILPQQRLRKITAITTFPTLGSLDFTGFHRLRLLPLYFHLLRQSHKIGIRFLIRFKPIKLLEFIRPFFKIASLIISFAFL